MCIWLGEPVSNPAIRLAFRRTADHPKACTTICGSDQPNTDPTMKRKGITTGTGTGILVMVTPATRDHTNLTLPGGDLIKMITRYRSFHPEVFMASVPANVLR